MKKTLLGFLGVIFAAFLFMTNVNTTNATTPTTRNIRGVAIIDNIRVKVALWDKPNGKVIRYLNPGSSWQAYQEYNDGKRGWINLGGNQWIDSQYAGIEYKSFDGEIPVYGTVQVTYKPHYSIVVWQEPGAKPINKYLPNGTRWQSYKIAYQGNQIWYNLGGNQWVPSKYVTEIPIKVWYPMYY